MKSINKVFLFLIAVVLISIGDLEAQTKRTRIEEEKPFNWSEKTWFGGGVGLQFGSASLGSGLDGNLFLFSLSPMAGYKIKPWWSVGPRAEFTISTGRFGTSGNIYKYTAIDYGIGVFTRAKFLNILFAHAEYLYRNQANPSHIDGNKIKTIRVDRDFLYGGLGYTSGDIWAYEFYLLYDFLDKSESTSLPLDYRLGITYRF